MKLFDKVYVKSQKTMGFIVDIVDDSYTVEKEGGYGPIYWNLPEDDLVPATRRMKKLRVKPEDGTGSRRPRKG